RSAKASDLAAGALGQLAHNAYSFNATVLGLQSAGVRADESSGHGQLLQGVLEGRASHLPVNNAAGVGLLGGPDERLFRESLSRVVAPLGAPGEELGRQAKSADTLSRILPDIINAATAKPLGEGDVLSTR